MQTIALVGPPGSGKSHRALLVSHERSIPLIVDDGLLIKDNHIIAGISSKRQPTKIGAMKTAFFTDDKHALEVKNKIKEINPSKILILGTSKRMINKICQRLELPEPSEIIYISEIATEEEIQAARRIRQKHGKHVIPAPTVEVKSRFSGLLIEPLPTIFKRRAESKKQKHFMVDQTIVQPTFNFYGSFFIANTAINQIISIAADNIEGVDKIYQIRTRTTAEGINISFLLSVKYGYYIPKIVQEVKESVKNAIEHMTNLYVLEINVLVKKIAMD